VPGSGAAQLQNGHAENFRDWHSDCEDGDSIPTSAVSKENRLRRGPEPVESFREAQPRYRFFFFFLGAAFLAFFAGFSWRVFWRLSFSSSSPPVFSEQASWRPVFGAGRADAAPLLPALPR